MAEGYQNLEDERHTTDQTPAMMWVYTANESFY